VDVHTVPRIVDDNVLARIVSREEKYSPGRQRQHLPLVGVTEEPLAFLKGFVFFLEMRYWPTREGNTLLIAMKEPSASFSDIRQKVQDLFCFLSKARGLDGGRRQWDFALACMRWELDFLLPEVV
jgi:hypothetical protein